MISLWTTENTQKIAVKHKNKRSVRLGKESSVKREVEARQSIIKFIADIDGCKSSDDVVKCKSWLITVNDTLKSAADLLSFIDSQWNVLNRVDHTLKPFANDYLHVLCFILTGRIGFCSSVCCSFELQLYAYSFDYVSEPSLFHSRPWGTWSALQQLPNLMKQELNLIQKNERRFWILFATAQTINTRMILSVTLRFLADRPGRSSQSCFVPFWATEPLRMIIWNTTQQDDVSSLFIFSLKRNSLQRSS